MNESNKEKPGYDVCKNHTARSDRADLSHICPSKLSKRELEDLYFVLLDNNLDLKRTINGQRDQIKVLSTKVLRMTAAQKCTLGREQKDCCAKTQAVVTEQRESIAELKRTNDRMTERIRLLNMRLCSAKQFLKRSPAMSKCTRCSATTTSLKNLSTSALNTKPSDSNLRTVNAASCQYLDKQASLRTVETETDEQEMESPEKLCNENRCRTLMEELKQKIIYLQEELSKTHEEYSIRVTRLEEEMAQLRADNVRVRSDRAASLHSLEHKEQKTRELTAQLRDTEARYNDLSMQLCIEKKKVAELETRVKVSQTTNAVAKTIEEHLTNANESNSAMKESSYCEYNPSLVYPPEWDEPSPRLEEPTTAQPQHNLSPDSTVLYEKHESKNSDDSGYADPNQINSLEQTKTEQNISDGVKVVEIFNQELLKKIVDLQSQLDYLKITAAGKRSFDFESYGNEVESQVIKNVNSVDLNVTRKRSLVKKEDNEEDHVTVDDGSKEQIIQKGITANASLLHIREANGEQSHEKSDVNIIPGETNKTRQPDCVTAEKKETYIEPLKINEREEVSTHDFLINKDAVTENEIDNNDQISSLNKITGENEETYLDKNVIRNKEIKKEGTDFKTNINTKCDGHNSFQIPGPLPTERTNRKSHIIANRRDSREIIIEKGLVKNDKMGKRNSLTYKTHRKKYKSNEEKAQSIDSKNLIKGQSFDDKSLEAPNVDIKKRAFSDVNGCNEKSVTESRHNINVDDNKMFEQIVPEKPEYSQLGTQLDPKLRSQKQFNEFRSSTPSQHRTYNIEASAELVKCSRSTSPENTDCEIHSLSDLPSERNDKTPREHLSPGEDKATSTFTTSYSMATSTDYESLSEGELPTKRGGRKLSAGERRMSDFNPDTKICQAESSSHKMESALQAIGEELARCRQLLQTQKSEDLQAEKPESKDASVVTEHSVQPSTLVLRPSVGKPRIGKAYAPKCTFTLHVGTVVLSDEAVISSRDISLMLLWKFHDQPAAMTRMRAGRVMHFDFSTEYDVDFTDKFMDYMKHEKMPIIICELDNQELPFASCALPLRDALLHTNRRADMSLALLAGPQLRQFHVATDPLDARDEVGVLDLWCMLRADPKLLLAINKAISQPSLPSSREISTSIYRDKDNDLQIMQQVVENDQPNEYRLSQDLEIQSEKKRKEGTNQDAEYPSTSQVDTRNRPLSSIQRSYRHSSGNHMDFYIVPKKLTSFESQRSQHYSDNVKQDGNLRENRIPNVNQTQKNDIYNQTEAPSLSNVTHPIASLRSTSLEPKTVEELAEHTSVPSRTDLTSNLGFSSFENRHYMNMGHQSLNSKAQKTNADNTQRGQVSFQDTNKWPAFQHKPSGIIVNEVPVSVKSSNDMRQILERDFHSNEMEFRNFPRTNKQNANNPFDNIELETGKKTSTNRESKRAVIIEPQQDFKPTLSAKDVMYPQGVNITVLWLALNEECEAMLNPKVRRLYIAYSFLGRNGAELETPVSLPKPKNYADKCYFHFKKTFHLMETDLPLLGHMAKCRSANKGVPNNKDCVVFTVISEPPEDPLGLSNCEDIGHAYLYLGDLLAYCTGDTYTEVIPIRTVQAEDSVCGVLAVRVEGLDVVRKCLDYLQEKGES